MTIYTLSAEQIASELAMLELILAERGEIAHEKAVKHAAKQSDPIFAKFFREKSNPQDIALRIESIRLFLDTGKLDEANQEFRILRTNLDYIAQEIRGAVFAREASRLSRWTQNRSKCSDSNAKKKQHANIQHRRWIGAAKTIWKKNPMLSASACASAVIRQLRLSESHGTVRKKIAVASPKKVGRTV